MGGLRAEDWEGWGMSGWFGGVRGVYTLVMNIEIQIIHEKTADHTSLLQQPQPPTFRFYLPKSLSPKNPLYLFSPPVLFPPSLPPPPLTPRHPPSDPSNQLPLVFKQIHKTMNSPHVSTTSNEQRRRTSGAIDVSAKGELAVG